MREIRAADIDDGMRIRSYDDDESFDVASVKWHGDTVLIIDTEGNPHTFDRDEVVERLEE